jgi:creatinine amidohydrolase/Fe(II)-dependent formamide hydrolase-like protein
VIRLADCTHREARALARDRQAVVLLPLGAIEQHGPHLPLSVDWLGAEEIARRLAPHLSRGGYRPVLAPSIPYGVSTLAIGWSGTVSLSARTLRRLVVEVVGALADHGFRRFVLTNYQADPDHLRVVGRIVDDLERTRGVQVLVAGFTPGAPAENAMANPRVSALMRSPAPAFEWHSGEVETSVMLSVAPRLVRRDVARALPPVRVDFRGALRRGVRRFSEMHRGAGYFGSPAVARAQTGRRIMALRTRLIARDLLRALEARRPARSRGRP